MLTVVLAASVVVDPLAVILMLSVASGDAGQCAGRVAGEAGGIEPADAEVGM